MHKKLFYVSILIATIHPFCVTAAEKNSSAPQIESALTATARGDGDSKKTQEDLVIAFHMHKKINGQILLEQSYATTIKDDENIYAKALARIHFWGLTNYSIKNIEVFLETKKIRAIAYQGSTSEHPCINEHADQVTQLLPENTTGSALRKLTENVTSHRLNVIRTKPNSDSVALVEKQLTLSDKPDKS